MEERDFAWFCLQFQMTIDLDFVDLSHFRKKYVILFVIQSLELIINESQVRCVK